VNFYRDMFRPRSHLLAPLTSQSGYRTLKGTAECQSACDQVKALLAQETLLQYPDHNKPFSIYTDASDYQMGSVLMQQGKPVAFFSRKRTSAQRTYTTGEKEILSILETLKEYRTMLFGCRAIHVYTDHRNLTVSTFQTQRVLRWRLLLEEYGPIKKNLAADARSRLPFSERQPSDHGSWILVILIIFLRKSPPTLRGTQHESKPFTLPSHCFSHSTASLALPLIRRVAYLF
jgi:hypothetical protein